MPQTACCDGTHVQTSVSGAVPINSFVFQRTCRNVGSQERVPEGGSLLFYSSSPNSPSPKFSALAETRTRACTRPCDTATSASAGTWRRSRQRRGIPSTACAPPASCTPSTPRPHTWAWWVDTDGRARVNTQGKGAQRKVERFSGPKAVPSPTYISSGRSTPPSKKEPAPRKKNQQEKG